jgi:predicted NBD/HSP70 family sugar kinase
MALTRPSSALDDDRSSTIVKTFEAICRDGPLPRGDLSWTLGASPSTITAAVQNLRRRRLVSETGPAASTGGRPPMVLDLAPAIGGVLAAAVGTKVMLVGAADLRGAIVARTTVRTPGTKSRLAVKLSEALTDVAAELHGPIRALTVAVPGTVDKRTGDIALVPNLRGWPNEHPSVWLSGFGAPVLVENSANLGALGEHFAGSAQDADSVLFLALGSGIGAGVLLGGELFGGSRGAAGDIGRLRDTIDGPTLQEELGADGIVRRYIEGGGDASLDSSEDILARIGQGDPVAAEVFERTLDRLAVAIANAVLVVDPSTVVIGGGGPAEAGDRMLEPLRDRLEKLLVAVPTIVLSRLGSDAALIGAAWFGARHAREAIVSTLDAPAVAG